LVDAVRYSVRYSVHQLQYAWQESTSYSVPDKSPPATVCVTASTSYSVPDKSPPATRQTTFHI
jgi:hypothetical protein